MRRMIDVLIGHHCRFTEFFHMRKVCRTKPDSSNHAFTTSTCYFHKFILFFFFFFFSPTNTFHSPPLQPKYFSHAHSRLLFTAIENPTTTTPSTRCPRNTTLPFYPSPRGQRARRMRYSKRTSGALLPEPIFRFCRHGMPDDAC